MLYKKSMLLSVVVVFSCSGMNTAPQGTAPQGTAPQGTAPQGSAHELVQRVARISLATSRMAKGCVGADDFNSLQEDIKTLRRSLVAREHNMLTQGSSPRVLAAVDCVLAHAGTHLVDGEQKFAELEKRSSLSAADKKTLFTAQIISFKHRMNGLFATINRKGRYYGDEPRSATNYGVTCDADGAMLAFVEALECFSKATDDTLSLCASCQYCPKDMWCSDCISADKAHSRIMPYVCNIARETETRVGVNDALWYLESRIGATSAAIDAYAKDVAAQKWQGSDRACTFAALRKSILQMAVLHKDISESVALMSDEQLRVETFLPLLENAPGSIGFAENVVKNTRSNNPLRFLPAQFLCMAALGEAATQLDNASRDLPEGMTLATIATLIRENAKSTLGISEKEVPLLCQMTHLFSRPLNLLIKDGVICLRESAADVDRFTTLYKKPLREQVLSSACSKQFELFAHAWQTGGIDVSGLKLIKNVSHKPDDNGQKKSEEAGPSIGKI